MNSNLCERPYTELHSHGKQESERSGIDGKRQYQYYEHAIKEKPRCYHQIEFGLLVLSEELV